MFFTSEFDFDLPPELIANSPFFPKEETKMLVCQDGKIFDKKVINLIDFLQAGDLLIFNDAKVFKAKLSGIIQRNSAKLEFNLNQNISNLSQVAKANEEIWTALCKPAKKVKAGDVVKIADDFSVEILRKNDGGMIEIKFSCEGEIFLRMLDKYGSIPLPPYIERKEKRLEDEKDYQTCYAKNGFAVAAPTAGLHFNEKIFDLLAKKKINKAFITLNVGAGTFLPVKAEKIQDHKMHSEFFEISKETADLVNQTKLRGNKIIAVGTTSLRALESASDESGILSAAKISTEIFIYPSYKFKIVDCLMTNFHLPKSTLFMLVSAFVGKEKAKEIYQHAIQSKYRFYSFGDASLLFMPRLNFVQL